jgi:hypothetical protein
MAAHRRVTVALTAALTLGASPALAAHTFDLAQHMPPHYAAMFMVNWFGVAKGDPQPGGLDPGYGNWLQNFPNCGLANDPSTCGDFQDAGRQRVVASKRRPLAGIYSSSARDAESKRRIDLVLSCVRRPCDSGARLDSFIVQLDSVKFTSRYPQNHQEPTWDIAYRALVGFLDEADAAGLDGAVTVGSDATVYWHFGTNVGLATEADREAALGADIADMATIATQHPSAARVNGKPLLAFYVDSALVTPASWQTILDGARAASGVDFYAIATTLDGTFFAAFDGLSPWVNLGLWGGATGATTHDRAVDYARQMHAKLLAQVAGFPGRVMLGGVAPGFDDYTLNWGACQPREIPRDPAVLQGQMDYLAQLGTSGSYAVKGVVFDTWDDWTEGTEFEPDVVEGTTKLVQTRQLLGALYGETVDPAGDQALDARWHAFGQARSCCFENGSCGDGGAAAVDLSCPPDGGTDSGADGGGGTDGGGPDASSGGSGDGGDGGASTNEAPGGSPSGCGCAVVSPGGALAAGASSLAALALVAWRRRTRRRAAPRA